MTAPDMAVRANLQHETCHHEIYGMTCEIFEMLLERSDGRCELCAIPAEQTPRGMLIIDHDGRYASSMVRGLICDKCNSHMRFVDSGERPCGPAEANYYRNSWFLDAAWFSAGGAPKVRRHVDWQTWIDFGRVVGRRKDEVLRHFMKWYAGAPGYGAPRRPQLPR
jgi:hypothetical protein